MSTNNLFQQAIEKKELLDFAQGSSAYFLVDRETGEHWVLGTWLNEVIPYCQQIGTFQVVCDMLLELIHTTFLPVSLKVNLILYHIHVFYYLKKEHRFNSSDVVKSIELDVFKLLYEYTDLLTRAKQEDQLQQVYQSIGVIQKNGGLNTYKIA